ncbi:acyl-CoA carboxylase subunit epsilon [Nocardioides sp. LHG3406-4]|uniref:acyl-CoA carboxylase subunit epsilon n=1 Tax=Nocardioides sp. LHG3406-4 TaxID=2804575 RepID=UPI003CF7A3AC
MSEPADQATPPLLTIVNTDATPHEIAALVAVLSALGSGQAPPEKPVSEWASHRRKVRRTLPHGPGGWRASALPR